MRTIEELMAQWKGPPIGAFERLQMIQRATVPGVNLIGIHKDGLGEPLVNLYPTEANMMIAHWVNVRSLLR